MGSGQSQVAPEVQVAPSQSARAPSKKANRASSRRFSFTSGGQDDVSPTELLLNFEHAVLARDQSAATSAEASHIDRIDPTWIENAYSKLTDGVRGIRAESSVSRAGAACPVSVHSAPGIHTPSNPSAAGVASFFRILAPIAVQAKVHVSRLTVGMPAAFPVVCGREGASHPVVAASRIGRGRVVVFGAAEFLNSEAVFAESPSTLRFVRNCLKWLARKERLREIHTMCDMTGTRRIFKEMVGCIVDARTRISSAALVPTGGDDEIDVVVIRFSDITATLAEALLRWVDGGGGLIVAGSGYSWVRRWGSDLRIAEGNLLLSQAGICVTAQQGTGTPPSESGARPERGARRAEDDSAAPPLPGAGIAPIFNDIPEFWIESLNAHESCFTLALVALVRGAEAVLGAASVKRKAWWRAAVDVVIAGLDATPPTFLSFEYLPKIADLRPPSAIPIPAAAAVRGDEDAIEAVTDALIWYTASYANGQKCDSLLAPKLLPWPSLTAGGAMTEPVTLELNLITTGWVTTGIFLRPGETLTVKAANSRPGQLSFRVGAHWHVLWDGLSLSDGPQENDPRGELSHVAVAEYVLGKDVGVSKGTTEDVRDWVRWPMLSTNTRLEADGTAKVFSPYGGPVYVEVVETLFTRSAQYAKIVAQGGGLAQPVWYRGRTTKEGWTSSLKTNTAPWSELVGDCIAFSLPTEMASNIEEPDALLEYYDSIVEAFEDFLPTSFKSSRAFRLVLDADRRNGDPFQPGNYEQFLFAVSEPEMRKLLDIDSLASENVWHLWAFLLRISEQFSKRCWPFDVLNLSTPYLYAAYVYEMMHETMKLRNIPYHPEMKQYLSKMRMHAAGHMMGAAPGLGSDDGFAPGTEAAFGMLLLIRRAFGWGIFRKVMLFCSKSLEKNYLSRQEWIDVMVDVFSSAANRNLIDFFAHFGFFHGVSEAVSDSDKRTMTALGTQKPPSCRQRWSPLYEQMFLAEPSDTFRYTRMICTAAGKDAAEQCAEMNIKAFMRRRHRRQEAKLLLDEEWNASKSLWENGEGSNLTSALHIAHLVKRRLSIGSAGKSRQARDTKTEDADGGTTADPRQSTAVLPSATGISLVAPEPPKPPATVPLHLAPAQPADRPSSDETLVESDL